MKTDSDFLNFIYKDGKVPIDDIESGKYQEVRSLIGKLCNALNGDAYPAGNPRPHISHTRFSPEESEQINRRIVEMREGPAMMSFKEIAKELNVGLNKDAVQKRYVNNADRLRSAAQAKTDVLLITPFKGVTETPLEIGPVRTGSELPCSAERNNIASSIKSEKAEDVTYFEVTKEVTSEPIAEKIEQVAEPPALQEAKPEPLEISTIREERIVEEIQEETKADVASEVKLETEAEIVAEIVRLAGIKKDMKWVSGQLRKKGISLSHGQVRSRYAHAKLMQKRDAAKGGPGMKLAEEPGVKPNKVLNSPDGAIQDPACRPEENLTESSPEEDQEPRAISRANLEGMIYDMYTKEHLSPAEISDRLYAQRLFYSEKTVKVRLQKLGVDI